jgi:hypothetical protein
MEHYEFHLASHSRVLTPSAQSVFHRIYSFVRIHGTIHLVMYIEHFIPEEMEETNTTTFENNIPVEQNSKYE